MDPQEAPHEVPYDVITMGRIGVDLYPLQTGVPLARVETFGKFLGGSPSNVAVAAARLGRRTALITRTGKDAFGDYLHEALREFGVDDRWVGGVEGLPTPVTFCEVFPPDDFPLYFYRQPKAPDLEIYAAELDLDATSAARVFWVTGTGLSEEPSRSATLAALEHRAKSGTTVFDLDWRPMFWKDTAWKQGTDAAQARTYYAQALAHATVAVGNLDEVEVATGEREPTPRQGSCWHPASSSPSSSRAPGACSPSAARARAPKCRPSRSRWSTASAPGTPSAGPSATDCSKAGNWSGSCGTRMPRARSSPHASPARPRCRTRTRSRRS